MRQNLIQIKSNQTNNIELNHVNSQAHLEKNQEENLIVEIQNYSPEKKKIF